MLRFFCAGKWSQPQVKLQPVAGQRVIVDEVEQAIEDAWLLAKARPGVNLFDGPMCRLESWETTPGQLTLNISRTSYKIFLGTNMAHPEFADLHGSNVMANPVGVSPALLTADNKLALGRRNSRVAYYPGRIHPFSGSLEPNDTNLFSAVARELQEELSLESDELTQIFCSGLVEDENLRQPELIFAVGTSRSQNELEAKLDRAEHQGMVWLDATRDEVESVIKDPELTPVAIGTLLLWGRNHFGQQWFDRVST